MSVQFGTHRLCTVGDEGDPIIDHHREQVGEVSLAAEHGMKGAGLLTFLSREAHAPEQVQEARLSVADNRLDLPWLNIRYVPRRQVMSFARPHTTMAPKQCTFATISGAWQRDGSIRVFPSPRDREVSLSFQFHWKFRR